MASAMAPPPEGDEHQKGSWARKLEQRREAYLQRGRLYKLLFIMTGVIITVAGLAMLVLPGPALVVIPIGLAMLAMEFAWAERMLERALDHAEKASAAAKETTRMQRVMAAVATALAVAAFAFVAIKWDIPVLPV